VCPFLPRARETSRHELCIVRVPAMLGRGSSGEHPEGSVTRQWEGEWPLGNRSRFVESRSFVCFLPRCKLRLLPKTCALLRAIDSSESCFFLAALDDRALASTPDLSLSSVLPRHSDRALSSENVSLRDSNTSGLAEFFFTGFIL